MLICPEKSQDLILNTPINLESPLNWWNGRHNRTIRHWRRFARFSSRKSLELWVSAVSGSAEGPVPEFCFALCSGFSGLSPYAAAGPEGVPCGPRQPSPPPTEHMPESYRHRGPPRHRAGVSRVGRTNALERWSSRTEVVSAQSICPHHRGKKMRGPAGVSQRH